MTGPLISIITPTYNIEDSIEKTILSIANQQYKAIEHLFIDNLSTDNTVPIIQSYMKKFNHQMKIENKNRNWTLGYAGI